MPQLSLATGGTHSGQLWLPFARRSISTAAATTLAVGGRVTRQGAKGIAIAGVAEHARGNADKASITLSAGRTRCALAWIREPVAIEARRVLGAVERNLADARVLRVIAAEGLAGVIAPVGILAATWCANLVVDANLIVGYLTAELAARNRVRRVAEAETINATLSGSALRIDATLVTSYTASIRARAIEDIITLAEAIDAGLLTRALQGTANFRWQALRPAHFGFQRAGASTIDARLRRTAVALRAAGRLRNAAAVA
jgi:hypothetical protein